MHIYCILSLDCYKIKKNDKADSVDGILNFIGNNRNNNQTQ